jgi:putative methyltransferase (TIGR04325 family)
MALTEAYNLTFRHSRKAPFNSEAGQAGMSALGKCPSCLTHNDTHPPPDKDFIMSLRGIIIETLKLPPFRPLARYIYDRFFERQRAGNHYRGVFASYSAALQGLPRSLTNGFDTQAAAAQYRHRIKSLTASQYPALFWLLRLLDEGERSVFDLGGHFGLYYYHVRRFRPIPADLRWIVCDLPQIVASGREWAAANDPTRQLAFTESNTDASGHDVLLAFGALQYFDYSLPELLARLDHPPRHIIVNMTPMHPTMDFYTVQNMGFAATPYHVLCLPDFVVAMQACGYMVVDQWQSYERDCHVPFSQGHDIDCYSGLYLRHIDAAPLPRGEQKPA